MNIPVIEGGFNEKQKVMLAKTVAEIHGMEVFKVNQLINNNIDEFEIGIDILDLKGTENTNILSEYVGITFSNNAINTHCRSILKQGIATRQGNTFER